MKSLFLLYSSLLFCLGPLSSQSVELSSFTIEHETGSLLVSNADTSYLFHAYVLTQLLNGIDSVTLVCEDLSANTWVPAKDTLYTWSLVTADTLSSSSAYEICKPNDNILKICLGRLYFAGRHRFTFTITGTNGLLTKEFIF